MIASTLARNVAVLGAPGPIGASALDVEALGADREARALTWQQLERDHLQTLPA